MSASLEMSLAPDGTCKPNDPPYQKNTTTTLLSLPDDLLGRLFRELYAGDCIGALPFERIINNLHSFADVSTRLCEVFKGFQKQYPVDKLRKTLIRNVGEYRSEEEEDEIRLAINLERLQAAGGTLRELFLPDTTSIEQEQAVFELVIQNCPRISKIRVIDGSNLEIPLNIFFGHLWYLTHLNILRAQHFTILSLVDLTKLQVIELGHVERNCRAAVSAFLSGFRGALKAFSISYEGVNNTSMVRVAIFSDHPEIQDDPFVTQLARQYNRHGSIQICRQNMVPETKLSQSCKSFGNKLYSFRSHLDQDLSCTCAQCVPACYVRITSFCALISLVQSARPKLPSGARAYFATETAAGEYTGDANYNPCQKMTTLDVSDFSDTWSSSYWKSAMDTRTVTVDYKHLKAVEVKISSLDDNVTTNTLYTLVRGSKESISMFSCTGSVLTREKQNANAMLLANKIFEFAPRINTVILSERFLFYVNDHDAICSMFSKVPNLRHLLINLPWLISSVGSVCTVPCVTSHIIRLLPQLLIAMESCDKLEKIDIQSTQPCPPSGLLVTPELAAAAVDARAALESFSERRESVDVASVKLALTTFEDWLSSKKQCQK